MRMSDVNHALRRLLCQIRGPVQSNLNIASGTVDQHFLDRREHQLAALI
jgi:hypothetical protein